LIYENKYNGFSTLNIRSATGEAAIFQSSVRIFSVDTEAVLQKVVIKSTKAEAENNLTHLKY